MRGLRLTEKIRTLVKAPLGSLVTGTLEETMATLKDILEKEKPKKLFVVGDFVTLSILKYCIRADLYIIDNKIMRKPIKTRTIDGTNAINARNLPGMISAEAWDAVKKGIENPSVSYIFIDGEEDLLTLPVIKFAPEGAIVVYGQPHMGIVVVRVTEKKREEIEALINGMEIIVEE